MKVGAAYLNWAIQPLLDMSQKTYSFCDMKTATKNIQPVANKALTVIAHAGSGYVFSPAELIRKGVGSRTAVNQALSRLTKAGRIRRLATGIYHLPRQNWLVGEVPPTPEAIAMAMARATGEELQVSEAQAANLMGVSTQVPGKYVYWTSGTPRVRQVGNTVIEFKRGSAKRLTGAGSTAGVVLQAIRSLGPERAKQMVGRLQRVLPEKERAKLLKMAAETPAWVWEIAQQIARETTHG